MAKQEKPEKDLFKGFDKAPAPIQKVVAVKQPIEKKEEKDTPLMLLLPEDFKNKLEIYKVMNKKKSLKSVIMELVGPAIGYENINV